MAQMLTIPIAALLAVVGVGAGVHLGNSAIDAINPLYFTPIEGTQSYASLSANQSPGWAIARKEDAGAMEFGTAGLGSGCVGCRTYPQEYHPQHDGSADGYAASAWTPDDYVPAQYPAYDESLPDDGIEQIERYTSYPVTHEEEAVRQAEPAVATELADAGAAPIGM